MMALALLLLGAAAAVVSATDPEVTSGAVHCQLGGGSVTYRMEPWGANSIRVRVGADPTIELPQQPLLAQPPKPVAHTAKDSASCNMTNGNIKVSLVGGKLHFVESSTGKLLLAETAHTVCSAGGAPCSKKTPGLAASIPPPGGITFASSPDERLYGLGEHRTGRLDNHGLSLDFEDAGVYDHHHAGDIVLPFYLSSHQYGFMWNMASFGAFNSSDTEIQWSSMSTPVLDFWVTTSAAAKPGTEGDFKGMLGQFADATGHPPKMPDFATGFWQCKNRYRSQEELLSTAREYKARELPISTIVIDYLHCEWGRPAFASPYRMYSLVRCQLSLCSFDRDSVADLCDPQGIILATLR
jgi:alpha-D-xyloside xylohydrolase